MIAGPVPDPARVLVTPPPTDGGDAPKAPVGGSRGAESPLPSAETPSHETALARLERPTGGFSLLAVTPEASRLVPHPTSDQRTTDGYLRMTARILLDSPRQGFRSIGVISAYDGEGRSAAAVNLAACLARAKGRQGRVLLVDADARLRTLTHMFCGEGEVGTGSESSRRPALIGTALDGVDLMTAPTLEDGLSISAPGLWTETFDELGALYPHILVDCPSVLDNPEGLVLRECVQQLVLVARAGRSTRKVVQRTLGAHAPRVLGVILNGPAAEGRASRAAGTRS